MKTLFINGRSLSGSELKRRDYLVENGRIALQGPSLSGAGADLGPDSEREDEYVALVNAQGVETKCGIEFSDLQNVKARLAAALPAGEYTLKVYTRSGMGEAFGVHVATRKVTVA